MHEDFKSEIVDLKVQDKLFKYRLPHGEETNSWVNDYIVPDPKNPNQNIVDIAEKNWCYLKNIEEIPYKPEDFEGLGVPIKPFKELEWKHRRKILGRLPDDLFSALKAKMSIILDNSDKKKS